MQSRRKCKVCGHFFTPTRKDHVYCKPYCRWLVWAARNPLTHIPAITGVPFDRVKR